MANYNSEKFREEYNAILREQNKSKTFKEEFEAVRAQMQGQTQSASVVNVQPQIKQNEQQIQQENYNRMQNLFAKSKEKEQYETDLQNINNQIQAITGYGVGADRSDLQRLYQQKDELEKQLKTGRYDEDLNVLERLQLTGQSIGESYNYTPDILIDTSIQAYKDHKANKGDAEYDTTRKSLADVTRQIAAMQYKINNGFANQVDMAEYNRLLNQQAQLEAVMNEKYRTPMNMETDAFKGMQRAMQAQQQATHGMGNVGKFLWNTGASIAENASLMPLVALPGGQTAITALMGVRAAAQKAVEVGESGGSAGDALFRGLSSGAIEAATERLPLEALADLIKGNVGKSIIKNVLKQAGLEAGEEAVAYMGNLWIDTAAKDPNARFSLKELGASMVAGAISGGVMGAGADVSGRTINRVVNGKKNAAGINDGTKSAAGAASVQQEMENDVQEQQDVADTDDGNKVYDNLQLTAKNDIKNSKSAINSLEFDTISANNVVENANKDVQNNIIEQSGNAEQLKKEMQQAAGIDTRTEVEKVAEEQQQYVDSVRELVETGVAPAEHLEQAQKKAAETVREAENRQANIDYQKLDAESGMVRQEAVDSGKGELVGNIEKFAAKRGLKVKYYIADASSAGNGLINGDTIYINVQDNDVMAKTAIHETIHGLRGNNQAEYVKLFNSIMDYAEQYRYLHEVADSVMAAYTNPDSVAYGSMLDNEGNVDTDKLGEEVLCKLCEEVITDPEGFIKNVDGDINVLSTVRELLRKIKNSLAISLTNSEKAKLDNAVMAIERYMKNDGRESTVRKNSLKLGGFANIKVTVKNIMNTYGLQRVNDYIHVQKQVFDTLKDNNFFDENLKRYETNADTGYIIEIDKGSIKETFNRDNFVRIPRVLKEIKLATIDKIPDIIKYGEVVEDNVKVTDNNKNRIFLYIKHPVEVDGKEHTIYVTIQKTSARNHFYVHSVDLNVNKIGLGASGADTETASALSELPSPNVRIPQVQKNDNGNNLSQNSGTQSSLVVPKVSNDTTSDRDNLSIREKIEAAANNGVTAKSRNVQTKAENTLIKTISNAFGVKYNDKQGIIKEMVKEISQQVKETGTVRPETITELVNMAFEKGTILDNEFLMQYPKLKKDLRSYKFKYMPSSVFQNVRNNYKGKIFFAKDGMDIDIAYKELSGRYNELFPADVTNPEDQIERIASVYDMMEARQQSLDEYYGDKADSVIEFISADLQYAVDKYISELNEVESFEADNRRRIAEAEERRSKKPPTMAEYKAAQDAVYKAQKVVEKLERELLLEEKDKNLINTLLAGGDPETVKGPKREKILAMYAAKKAVQDARAPIKQYQADVRSKRNAMADDVLTTFRGWKDKINGLAFSTETFERNIRDIVPDKTEAQKIIDLYITPIHTAEANSVRLKNKMRDRVKALGINTGTKAEDLYEIEVYDKDKPYKLQANESGLVQLLGEKKITKAQLQEVGADVAKIEKAVAEFRKIYEELYEMANDALLRNGYSPLGKIKDYFPHFTEENDTMLSKLAARAGFEVQTNRLPTSIAGITETFKPGKRWWGNMQHRTGETTLFDAVTGFDQYIEGVAGIIYQTDNIQNLRSLENRLRYLSSDKGLKEQIDAIDADDRFSEIEKQEKRERAYEEAKQSSLPHFVTYLRDYTNNLAGKKDFSDRQIEHDLGRGVYTVSKALESRIASNMIGGNIGSALTNFIPIAQATGEVKSKHLRQAMNDTMRAMYGHDNGFEVESDFLTNRFGGDKLVYTLAQRMSNKAGYLMNICDRFTSNVVTRAKYLQNKENGMDHDSAMANANSFAAGLLADRSKGAVPLVFERKNPLLKAVTMFQVEQNNQLRYLIKDLPKGLEKEGIRALTVAILKYSIASWMYNLAYQFIVGRKPAFDPIDIGFGLVSDAVSVAKGEMKTSAALTNAATTVAEELPFVSGLVGGGRVPISSALPDAAEVVKLFDADVSAEKKKSIASKELTKPLWYLAAPTAGGQAKKAAEAAALYFLNGGVEYGVESDGDKKAKFAVDTNNVLKAGQTALFGKWSSKEAREYIDNNFKGLTVGQTENFEIFKSWGMSNSEAFAKAKGTSAMTDKQLETLQLLQEAGMKNSTAYEMATTAKASADKDGNGSVKTEEAKAYLDSKNFTREQKAILFSCMCPGVKNNPYE